MAFILKCEESKLFIIFSSCKRNDAKLRVQSVSANIKIYIIIFYVYALKQQLLQLQTWAVKVVVRNILHVLYRYLCNFTAYCSLYSCITLML